MEYTMIIALQMAKVCVEHLVHNFGNAKHAPHDPCQKLWSIAIIFSWVLRKSKENKLCVIRVKKIIAINLRSSAEFFADTRVNSKEPPSSDQFGCLGTVIWHSVLISPLRYSLTLAVFSPWMSKNFRKYNQKIFYILTLKLTGLKFAPLCSLLIMVTCGILSTFVTFLTLRKSVKCPRNEFRTKH